MLEISFLNIQPCLEYNQIFEFYPLLRSFIKKVLKVNRASNLIKSNVPLATPINIHSRVNC